MWTAEHFRAWQLSLTLPVHARTRVESLINRQIADNGLIRSAATSQLIEKKRERRKWMNLSLTHEWHNWVVDLFDWTITPHEISFERDGKRGMTGASDSQRIENNDLQVLIQWIDRDKLFGKYVDDRVYHRCCFSLSRFRRGTHDPGHITRERKNHFSCDFLFLEVGFSTSLDDNSSF